MDYSGNAPTRRAFTLIELLITVAMIAILAAMLLPASGGSAKARVVVCARYLKELGENFNAWAKEHDGRFPYQVSVTNGGSMELAFTGSAIVHLKPLTNSGLVFSRSSSALTNIEGRSTYVTRWTTNYGLEKQTLVCPSDRHRANYSAASMAEVVDTNLSYFVSLSEQLTQTNSILAGDRHLLMNQVPVKPGLLTINAKASLGWSKELHGSFEKGNLLFADGHVAFEKKPASFLVPQGQPTTLAIP